MDFKLITLEDVVKGTDWLYEVDQLEGGVDKKLEVVGSAIECPIEYLKLFTELIKLIETKLRAKFSINNQHVNVKALEFGSVLTGLSLKNSDLDLYVEFDPPLGPHEQTLKMIRKHFNRREFHDVFRNVILVRAKVPILRCDHVIGFQCDISVSNALGRHNSEIVKFFISLNERYRLFFLLVKLWAKRLDLLSLIKWKSYSLVLLIIFYLQQKQLAPTVLSLQTHPQSPPPRLIEGWDSSFLADKDAFSDISAKQLSVLNLLTDFFEFYARFEFGFYIISPFTGEAILKPFHNSLNNFKLYNESSGKLKESSFACVQDLFQHDFNTSGNISKSAVVDFQNYCNTAAALCKSNNDPIMLRSLLPCSGTESRTSKKKKKKKSNAKECATFCPGLLLVEGCTEQEMREAWLARTLEAIERVLTRVALAEVCSKERGVFKCEIVHQAFSKKLRTEVARKLWPTAGPQNQSIEELKLPHMERLEAISKAIAELPEQKLDAPFPFQVNYTVQQMPSCVKVEVSQIEGMQWNSSNFTILQILETQLGHWLSLIDQSNPA